MKTIHKYQLDLADAQTIQMPAYADLLSIQVQGGKLMAWAVVDTNQPKVDYRFQIFGTGHNCDGVGKLMYRTSVQQGAFVWHVFEEPRCACSPPCIPWHNSQ